MSTQQVNYLINVTGNLEAKLQKATQGFDKLDKEVDRLKAKVGKGSGGLAGAFKSLGGVIGGALAVQRVIAFGKASVEAFDKQEQAIAQVRTGLISTGNVAGRTLEQLTTQASELQKKTIFGDEEILQGATAQLLTFTNIAGEQFDRTQMAVLDLSSRMGTDLKSSAIQLGKALNDPVANLSALSRSGIQFTKSQKATIKGLVETNRLAEAQTIILGELETQFGGSAEAAAKAGLGPFKQLQNAFGDFQEKVGGSIAQIGSKFIPLMTFLVDNLEGLMDALKFLFEPMLNIFKVIKDLLPGMGKLGTSTKVLGNIFRVTTSPMRLAWWLLGKLIDGLVWYVKTVKTAVTAILKFVGAFDFLKRAFNKIVSAVTFLIDHFKDMPIILGAALGAFKDFAGSLIDIMLNTGKSIFNILKESLDIGKIISGDTSGIKDATRNAVIQLQEDLGKVDLKKNFQLRLTEGLRQKELAKIKTATTSLNASVVTTGTGTGEEELTDVSSEVTGTKSTNINLNIEKLIENLNFNTSSLSETTGKIKEEVTKVLIEALRDTTAIATN